MEGLIIAPRSTEGEKKRLGLHSARIDFDYYVLGPRGVHSGSQAHAGTSPPAETNCREDSLTLLFWHLGLPAWDHTPGAGNIGGHLHPYLTNQSPQRLEGTCSNRSRRM